MTANSRRSSWNEHISIPYRRRGSHYDLCLRATLGPTTLPTRKESDQVLLGVQAYSDACTHRPAPRTVAQRENGGLSHLRGGGRGFCWAHQIPQVTKSGGQGLPDIVCLQLIKSPAPPGPTKPGDCGLPRKSEAPCHPPWLTGKDLRQWEDLCQGGKMA